MPELDEFIEKYRALYEKGKRIFEAICGDFGITKDQTYSMESEVDARGGWLNIIIESDDLAEFTIRYDMETKEFVVHFNGFEGRNTDHDDAAYQAYKRWRYRK